MSIADIKKNAQDKMGKSLETLKADLAKVRTGRAHTGILDHVMVEYYGNPTPINQVANLTLVDARTIGVTPFEKKMASAIEKAIRDADLGLNPAAARKWSSCASPKPKTRKWPCVTSVATPTKA
jgi:ribosome recycling factor